MDKMRKKTFQTFLKEMPSKTVVFAFGRFQPPTSGHGLLVNLVQKVAKKNKADHVIYVSKTKDNKGNPLSVDTKVKYLKTFFPSGNFVGADASVRSFIEAAGKLSKKYDHLIMIAGSDRVKEYERILNTYNGKDFDFETVQVLSAGERDPDADNVTGISGTKMRNAAKEGDFKTFKKGLPKTAREVDGKALFNALRKEYGLDPIKEELNSFDKLREQFISGDLYSTGDIVHNGEDFFEVLDVKSNYLLLSDENGELKRSWYKNLTLAEEPILAHIDPMIFKWIDKKIHSKEYKKAVSIYIRAVDGDKKILDILNINPTNPNNVSKEYLVSRIASVFSNLRVDTLMGILKDVFSPANYPNKIIRQKYAIYEEEQVDTNPDSGLQVSFKGYTTKNFHLAPRAREAFTHSIYSTETEDNPIATLQAIKLVDKLLGVQHKVYKNEHIELTVNDFMEDMEKIVNYLEAIDDLDAHEDYLNDIREYMFRVAFETDDEEGENNET